MRPQATRPDREGSVITLVTKTQLEGTSPQADNRVSVRSSAENLEAVRVGRSEASVQDSIPVRRDSLLAKRARGGRGKGRSRSERCVRGLKKKS